MWKYLTDERCDRCQMMMRLMRQSTAGAARLRTFQLLLIRPQEWSYYHRPDRHPFSALSVIGSKGGVTPL